MRRTPVTPFVPNCSAISRVMTCTATGSHAFRASRPGSSWSRIPTLTTVRNRSACRVNSTATGTGAFLSLVNSPVRPIKSVRLLTGLPATVLMMSPGCKLGFASPPGPPGRKVLTSTPLRFVSFISLAAISEIFLAVSPHCLNSVC